MRTAKYRAITNFISSEILRRFPGLLILDGVNLNRIIFPIERKPKVLIDEDVKRGYLARPLSFPMNVQGGFVDNEIVKGFVMSFCAKYAILHPKTYQIRRS